MVFLILGISIVAILAKTKDKRIYEYFVVSGLDRVRFFAGILGYTSIEMLGACLFISIVFSAVKLLSNSFVVNFFIPFFLFPQAINFCFSFGLFSFGLM